MSDLVWVVFEEDRGAGVLIIGVYWNEEDAIQMAKQSGHYWVQCSKVV